MHACMHGCMYVCVYVCMCVCMCLCMYVPMYVCTYVRTYVYMYVCVAVHIQIYIYTCLYFFMCLVHSICLQGGILRAAHGFRTTSKPDVPPCTDRDYNWGLPYFLLRTVSRRANIPTYKSSLSADRIGLCKDYRGTRRPKLFPIQHAAKSMSPPKCFASPSSRLPKGRVSIKILEKPLRTSPSALCLP